MKRILCYGDSNTFGHDPKDGSRLPCRWPKLLRDMLGGEYEIIEAGLSGRTTNLDDPFTPWMNGETLLQPTLWTSQPLDLVILMLGTNDLQLKHNRSAKEIAGGVDSLLSIIENPSLWDKKNAKILLISPIHLYEKIGEMEFSSIFGGMESVEKSYEFDGLLRPLAEKHGAFYLNAAEFALPSKVDGLHMDPEDHQKLANAVYDKVLEILK